MPATFQDILLAGGGLPGSWVRLVNNLTSTPYVSSAATTGPGGTAGLFSIPNPPPGVYTVYTGPSATGPWTATGENFFIVAPTPADSMAWTGLQTFGVGDVNNLTGSLPTTGRSIAVYAGTAAAPDTTVLSPPIKVSRFQKYLDSDPFGTNSDPTKSAIEIDVTVDVASERQGIGIYNVVETYSTTTPASGKSADAFPFFGLGIVSAGGTHTGAGAYLEGRKLGTGGVAEGLEIHVNNSSGSDNAFVNTSFSRSAGIWLTSAGTNLVGVGLAIGGQSPSQFDVGIGFTTYSGISAVKTATFYDHATAATSILIDNTHATAAIAISAGSGPIVIGGTSLASATDLLEVIAPNSAADPLVTIGSASNTQSYGVN